MLIFFGGELPHCNCAVSRFLLPPRNLRASPVNSSMQAMMTTEGARDGNEV